jgi:myosin-5
LPHQDFAEKLGSQCAKSSRFTKSKRNQLAFSLDHYAGPVSYQVDNFQDKNKDFVVEEHQLLLGAAECELIAQLFSDKSADEVRKSGLMETNFTFYKTDF